LKSIISIFIISGTLLGIAFLQMEERRLGYGILKLTREQKQVFEDLQIKSVQLAKVQRPQNIETVAQNKLVLRRVTEQQIIHITGADSIFLSQAMNPNLKTR
jgi:hypothetical protein